MGCVRNADADDNVVTVVATTTRQVTVIPMSRIRGAHEAGASCVDASAWYGDSVAVAAIAAARVAAAVAERCSDAV